MAAADPDGSIAVRLRHVSKRYAMGDRDDSLVVQALKDVSIDIRAGEFVAIMGPSGSGKSTLMHVIGLLDSPSEGTYALFGNEVSRLGSDALAHARGQAIGFVFQQFHLLPRLSALANVALPLLYSHGAPDEALAHEPLARVGLASREQHTPLEMSGGQQQRVAIARALIQRPGLILADEPTGNLDSASEREIMALLHELHAQGHTIVIVTHEESIGAEADRIIRLRDGRVVESHPSSPSETTTTAPLRPSLTPPSARKQLSWTELKTYARLGLGTIWASKLRSALSILGVLIGVAAVVAMLALGRGAQRAVEEQLSALGTNLVIVRPGAIRVAGVRTESGTTTRLIFEDAAAITREIPGIRESSLGVNGRGQVTLGSANWNTLIVGAAAHYERSHAATPTVGRFFSDEEDLRRERVALIGTTVQRELFGDTPPVGSLIRINRISFRVVGVLPEKGANSFRDQDDVVVVPLRTAMYRLFGKEYGDYIDVEVDQASTSSELTDRINQLLIARKRVPPSQQQDAFQVRNMADIQAALSASSKTFSSLLAAIAAVSLLVGGIGIMNVMLVSVTERTREIGVRKAIGARSRDIGLQFLAESVVLSGLGGGFGVVVGSLLAWAIGALAGWRTVVGADSILLAVTFAVVVGIVFGLYPAARAARLNPIDALRAQ